MKEAPLHPSEMELAGQTVPELVHHWGSLPDSNWVPAFISFTEAGSKRQLTRKEVLKYSRRFAHRLNQLGVGKGEVVVNALPNSPERVVCDFGIQFCGATSMNGQIFRSDGEDFLGSLETSKCQLVIVDPSAANKAREMLLPEVPYGQEDCVKSKRLPHLKRLLLCTRDDKHPDCDFLSSLATPDLPEFTEKVTPSDLATVMTTSGSTGYSKLVKLTHANICHFALQVKAIEPLQPGDHFMNCAPLGWAGGYPQWYLGCGVTRYFLDMHDGPPNDLPSSIWKTMVSEKIIYGFLSPMYVNAILSNPSLWEDAPWKPRTLCLAGQPVRKEQLSIIGKLCDSVDINYGITECNLVTTHRITNVSSYSDGCAGYPGFGVKMKIIDKDNKEVPQGRPGEIIIWSPALCQGYLHNDIATGSAFTPDGWFHTDDAGYIGEDGKLYVEGRQSDSILRGAYLLYPGWLEDKLRGVAGVKDVAVVAVPDSVLHNEICAFVVTDKVAGTVPGAQRAEEMSSVLNGVDGVDSGMVPSVEIGSEVLSKPSRTIESNTPGPSNLSTKSLDQIRNEGLHKPLTVLYNETTAKHLSDKCENTGHSKNVQLQIFEQSLRESANRLQVLSEKDAMRMVPKYYIFSDRLPLTNTGKISKKEIRQISASLLQLD